MRHFEISDTAVVMAKKLGIHGETAKRLDRMAARSAPYTSALGNRRFEDFILHIEDGVLVSVVLRSSSSETTD